MAKEEGLPEAFFQTEAKTVGGGRGKDLEEPVAQVLAWRHEKGPAGHTCAPGRAEKRSCRGTPVPPG